MTIYDQARLQDEVAKLPAKSTSTTAHGKKLQDLFAWLVGEVPSVTIIFKNKHDAGNVEEKDLWFKHAQWLSGLPFSDSDIPVECKNEAASVSAEEVHTFGRKISKSGGRDGILVSRAGLSGKTLTAGHLAVREVLQTGTRIVVLTAEDLLTFKKPTDLVALVVARHTELRTEQAYRTV